MAKEVCAKQVESKLMPDVQQHDGDEEDLTDVVQLAQTGKQLLGLKRHLKSSLRSPGATSLTQSLPLVQPDTKSVYEGYIKIPMKITILG